MATRYWLRARRFIIHRILHADDTPHAIALGVSVGVFVGIMPILGLQMITAVAISALVRANKAVSVPMVWISNPFTFIPLYGGCLALGRFVLGSQVAAPPEVVLSQLSEPVKAASWMELEFWQELLLRLAKGGMELWVGCLVVAIPCALIAYPLIRWLVSTHRERRRRRILQRQLFRTRLPSRTKRQTEVA